MAENNFETSQMNSNASKNSAAANDMQLSGGHLTAEEYGFTSSMIPDENNPANSETNMNFNNSNGNGAADWSGISGSNEMAPNSYHSDMDGINLWSDHLDTYRIPDSFNYTPERAISDRAISDRAVSDRTISDRTISDSTVSDNSDLNHSVPDGSASDNRSISVNLPNWPSFPIFSNCTNCASSGNYAQVRFLNASSNSFPVNIFIDNTAYAINSRFGTISNYDPIADGFHTISVRRATGLRTLLLQKTLPFTAGLKYTIVLVDTAAGGLNLVQVNDSGCNTLNPNTGCYRVANMTFSGSSFDVFLYSHDALFLGVDFQEVTPYKQAMAGSYQFYITNSNNFSVIRELPMIIIGAITGSTVTNEPLVSYQVDITAGSRYTTYLLGNTWSNGNLRLLTVQD